MAMAIQTSYEEVRRQRVQENLKHLEDLGISDISKRLSEFSKSDHKRSPARPKPKKVVEITELRRSARARTQIASYRDEVDIPEFRLPRRRSNTSRSEYNGRISSYKEQALALEKAERIQSDLKSDHPSFVKVMGLPTRFCKEHLPPNELHMVIEDENGSEYDAICIGSRTGLSGGWRGFAMDHDLEDGDALVFELSEPDRFKIYITKACGESNQGNNDNNGDAETENSIRSAKRIKLIGYKSLSSEG